MGSNYASAHFRSSTSSTSADAERAAAEKAEADKKAAEDAAAAIKAAASAWPTGGHNSFIPLLLFSVLTMLALYVDLSAISVVCACLSAYQYAFYLCQCHASDLLVD